jgi:hypothetical protein
MFVDPVHGEGVVNAPAPVQTGVLAPMNPAAPKPDAWTTLQDSVSFFDLFAMLARIFGGR